MTHNLCAGAHRARREVEADIAAAHQEMTDEANEQGCHYDRAQQLESILKMIDKSLKAFPGDWTSSEHFWAGLWDGPVIFPDIDEVQKIWLSVRGVIVKAMIDHRVKARG